MEIFTYGYFPFAFDGKVVKPVKCDLPVTSPVDLAAGRQGYLITGPNGGTRVVDATTGLIIGRTLEQVRTDLNAKDPQMFEAHFEKIKAILADATLLTLEQFWSVIP